jgi:hypothetical protein
MTLGRDGHDAALRSSADEAGAIKSSPNAFLAEGADCRFLNELKRELKASDWLKDATGSVGIASGRF